MAKKSAAPLPQVPTHVAIIMDGNGRWALARGLPRLVGHRAGTENLRRIITACVEFGVKYLTIYAFSTENWGRPREEVEGLMNILEDVIDRELAELNKEGVQMRHIGRLERLDPKLQEKVLDAIELTKHNDRLVLNVAFNYGGRDEIVFAIQKMINDGVKPEEVTSDLVSRYLFTADSEWYVTSVYWPDFNKDEFRKALDTFAQRDRRFGGLSQVDGDNDYHAD
jgi:undecaprenyl diphosphate synthase